jgi:hypothetical protein
LLDVPYRQHPNKMDSWFIPPCQLPGRFALLKQGGCDWIALAVAAGEWKRGSFLCLPHFHSFRVLRLGKQSQQICCLPGTGADR